MPDSLALHVLARCTFGPTRALLAEVEASGVDAWLESQLVPGESADEEEPTGRHVILGLSARDLRTLYNARSDIPRRELRVATFRRAVESRWQLRERLVEFWSDHFHVHMSDRFSSFLKPVDDREVVRAHALGRFEDLLLASAHSPAMLHYLDQNESVLESPNENYARELCELHTLGAGHYTEDDVRAVARLLTGWGFSNDTLEFEFRPDRHDREPVVILGKTYGRSGSTGYEDGIELLRDLARHPSTSRFLARKLCRRFVRDTPPDTLVEKMAVAYRTAGTDIPQMLRTMFASPEFRSSRFTKLRRPFDLLAAVFRVLEAEVRDDAPPVLPALQSVTTGMLRSVEGAIAGVGEGLGETGNPLEALPLPSSVVAAGLPDVGAPDFEEATARALDRLLDSVAHAPFRWPAPDGYPDVATAWQHAGGLLSRWNAILDVVLDRVTGVRVSPEGWFEGTSPPTWGALADALFERIVLRPAAPPERDAILGFLQADADAPVDPASFDTSARHVAALVASSPVFQLR